MIEQLRQSPVNMVLVFDEYGHFEGLVTPADLLSAIAGEFASDQDIGTEPFVVERDDGSLLISDDNGGRVLRLTYAPPP